MQFKSLAEIQKFLERSDIVESVFKDPRVVEILRDEMQKAVNKVVYQSYKPKQYTRRKDDGGLSDKRNMHVTKVEIVNGTVRVLFENLTQGQNKYIPIYQQSVDSLNGQFITDTITEYRPENWIRDGVWTQPRDFLTETVNNIKANPQPLINAIKSAYVKIGFKVK